jgi:hypothetical protein
MDLNDRMHHVTAALHNGDCSGARRALVASEAVADGDPGVVGLRKTVESACPPR